MRARRVRHTNSHCPGNSHPGSLPLYGRESHPWHDLHQALKYNNRLQFQIPWRTLDKGRCKGGLPSATGLRRRGHTRGGGRIYCTGIGIKASGWLRMRTCMNPSGPRPKLKPELLNIMIATRLTLALKLRT